MRSLLPLAAGVLFFLYAAWASATGEMTTRRKFDFYLTTDTLKRADDPVGFGIMILAVCALGAILTLMGVAAFLFDL